MRARGRTEASFANKMLAMLHPYQPIWDKYVIHNLGLDVPGKDPEGMVDCMRKSWNGMASILVA